QFEALLKTDVCLLVFAAIAVNAAQVGEKQTEMVAVINLTRQFNSFTQIALCRSIFFHFGGGNAQVGEEETDIRTQADLLRQFQTFQVVSGGRAQITTPRGYDSQ